MKLDIFLQYADTGPQPDGGVTENCLAMNYYLTHEDYNFVGLNFHDRNCTEKFYKPLCVQPSNQGIQLSHSNS